METKNTQSLESIDGYAKTYNTVVDFDRHFIRYRFECLKEHYPRLGTVLELGCADGLMTKEILGISKKLDVVEGSASYIRNAKKRLGKKVKDVRFYHSLFKDYEPDTKYDMIILSSILHELDDPILVLKKVRTWLKKGGVIYVNVPNAISLHRRIGRLMGVLKNEYAFTVRDTQFLHQRLYDQKSLRATVKKAGFSIIEEGGFFLKALSNSQMMNWDQKLLDAFNAVGKELDPSLCAEIYIFAMA